MILRSSRRPGGLSSSLWYFPDNKKSQSMMIYVPDCYLGLRKQWIFWGQAPNKHTNKGLCWKVRPTCSGEGKNSNICQTWVTDWLGCVVCPVQGWVRSVAEVGGQRFHHASNTVLWYLCCLYQFGVLEDHLTQMWKRSRRCWEVEQGPLRFVRKLCEGFFEGKPGTDRPKGCLRKS